MERPPNFICKVIKNTKKDIMGVRNINVLVGENEILYFRINENENNLWKSI